MLSLIDKLKENNFLKKEEFIILLKNRNAEIDNYIFKYAQELQKKYFGNKIFIRGLIEFTNYCKNDCYYCGIRKGNLNSQRYRLTKDEILSCCENGYNLGFKTFVLQGGEDLYYSDDDITDIVKTIKQRYSECAVTLSIGERSHESYVKFFEAGADRFLLRHETANEEHYSKLHPNNLSLSARKKCLYSLKEIGFQVGCGFMVGSPYQTLENIVEDLFFIKELSPHMVGIGPFISHADTCFSDIPNGSVELTLFLLSVVRLMIPNVLLPATTALGTLESKGREKGILAGANVLMPNLSPISTREKYALYDNKICTGEEAAECLGCLEKRVESIGYTITKERGDYEQIKK